MRTRSNGAPRRRAPAAGTLTITVPRHAGTNTITSPGRLDHLLARHRSDHAVTLRIGTGVASAGGQLVEARRSGTAGWARWCSAGCGEPVADQRLQRVAGTPSSPAEGLADVLAAGAGPGRLAEVREGDSRRLSAAETC